jgi:hypothetical protein
MQSNNRLMPEPLPKPEGETTDDSGDSDLGRPPRQQAVNISSATGKSTQIGSHQLQTEPLDIAPAASKPHAMTKPSIIGDLSRNQRSPSPVGPPPLVIDSSTDDSDDGSLTHKQSVPVRAPAVDATSLVQPKRPILGQIGGGRIKEAAPLHPQTGSVQPPKSKLGIIGGKPRTGASGGSYVAEREATDDDARVGRSHMVSLVCPRCFVCA